jgi:isocitrate dehydrogenase kinase/phosphatase
VPIRVYRIGGSLRAAVGEIISDLPFGAAIHDQEAAVHRISAEIGRYFESGRQSGAPESIELIEPVFYRGMHAFAVGRLIGDSSITPLVMAFTNSAGGVHVDAVMLSRADVGSLFGYARSYFHVDLPVVSAAITLLRSFMPRKPIDELYTVLGRAKQGKTERYFALQRHLSTSIDSFVHAPGERGLVMIVFTLPSHDLVFKVIRDHFGAPKTSTRAEVIERYQFVFRRDRAGRLVDAQEFKRLRLPRARFMPALADELLRDASQSCRIEGEDLIVEHCYIERRLRPLNLFLREAEPAAAEAAIIDYGNALRDLAASKVFPRHLLRLRRTVPGHGLRVPRPPATELRGGRDQRRAVVSLRAARRVPGAVAAVPVDPACIARGVPAAPRRLVDGIMVALAARAGRSGCHARAVPRSPRDRAQRNQELIPNRRAPSEPAALSLRN